MRLIVLVLIFSVLAFASACNNTRTIDSLSSASNANSGDNSRRAGAAADVAPTPVEDGRNLFVANCIGCHGRGADGNTPAGRTWHVPDLHSTAVQAMSDQQLLQIIHGGKGKMPAWSGLLSDTDIDHLLAYVRSLKAQ